MNNLKIPVATIPKMPIENSSSMRVKPGGFPIPSLLIVPDPVYLCRPLGGGFSSRYFSTVSRDDFIASLLFHYRDWSAGLQSSLPLSFLLHLSKQSLP